MSGRRHTHVPTRMYSVTQWRAKPPARPAYDGAPHGNFLARAEKCVRPLATTVERRVPRLPTPLVPHTHHTHSTRHTHPRLTNLPAFENFEDSMKEQIPEAVFWCVAVGLLAVTVLLVRQRGITARLRRRTTELADDVRSREEEVRHLVAVRLPALADHGPQQPLAGVGLLDARLSGSGFAKSLDHVLERFATAVEYAQARADQSAKAALKSSMRSIQALANEQQVAISDMQDRHDRPDVLRDLLEIDHANAQFGRRAQAIAVLCGSWPGRQRSTSALIEVVRGATSASATTGAYRSTARPTSPSRAGPSSPSYSPSPSCSTTRPATRSPTPRSRSTSSPCTTAPA